MLGRVQQLAHNGKEPVFFCEMHCPSQLYTGECIPLTRR